MKFIIKLILNGIIVVPALLWFSRATLMQALMTAVILCILAYVIGDQWILRASNNTVATISDAILSIAILWIANVMMKWNLSWVNIIAISLVLGVVEALLHRFVMKPDQRAAA